jgi:hypothetical protein
MKHCSVIKKRSGRSMIEQASTLNKPVHSAPVAYENIGLCIFLCITM